MGNGSNEYISQAFFVGVSLLLQRYQLSAQLNGEVDNLKV
jgi:hypothetical protein